MCLYRKAVNNFDGYTDRAATEKKLLTDVFQQGDCYFNSGDLLVMDELGYFYFRDRTGDTFRWRGENVSTAEVEAAAGAVLGPEAELAAYGVEVPGAEGRAGMLAIASPDIDLQKFAAGLECSLPTYARPLFLRLSVALPRTATFKVRKIDLQRQGFDPAQVQNDRLFFYEARQHAFQPLNVELYQNILHGKLRL